MRKFLVGALLALLFLSCIGDADAAPRRKARWVCRDAYGNAQTGCTVTVKLQSDSSLATIYTTQTGATADADSKVAVDSSGAAEWWIDSHDYPIGTVFKLYVEHTTLTPQTISNVAVDSIGYGAYTVATAQHPTIPVEIPYGVTITATATLTYDYCPIAGDYAWLTLSGAGSVVFPAGCEVRSAWFSSLSAAATAIGSQKVVLRMSPGASAVSADLSLPSTLSVIRPQGATFTVASGKTLTIAGYYCTLGNDTANDGSGTLTISGPMCLAEDNLDDLVTITDVDAAADYVPLVDASDSTAKKATVTDLFESINDLTADTSPVSGDFLMTYDVSASTVKKATVADIVGSYSGSVSLMDYGCVGDGTTDDCTCIAAGVTAAAGKTLVVPPGSFYLKTCNQIVPATVALDVQKGGTIKIADNYQLAVAGPIKAGPYQIFSDWNNTYDGVQLNDNATANDGTRATALANGPNVYVPAVYPQWWGGAFNCSDENCTTGTDDRNQWQKALNAFPKYGGLIEHTGGRSKVGSTLLWPISGTTGIPITIRGNNHAGAIHPADTDTVDAGSSQIVFTGSRALFDCRNGTTSALGTDNITWKGRLENIGLVGPYRFDWNWTGLWTANTAYGSTASTTYVIPRGAIGSTNYAQAIAAKAARVYFQATTPGTSHATTEPAWDATIGNTTADGTVVWTAVASVPHTETAGTGTYGIYTYSDLYSQLNNVSITGFDTAIYVNYGDYYARKNWLRLLYNGTAMQIGDSTTTPVGVGYANGIACNHCQISRNRNYGVYGYYVSQIGFHDLHMEANAGSGIYLYGAAAISLDSVYAEWNCLGNPIGCYDLYFLSVGSGFDHASVGLRNYFSSQNWGYYQPIRLEGAATLDIENSNIAAYSSASGYSITFGSTIPKTHIKGVTGPERYTSAYMNPTTPALIQDAVFQSSINQHVTNRPSVGFGTSAGLYTFNAQKGGLILNTAPTSSSALGWQYTEAGNGGLWGADGLVKTATPNSTTEEYTVTAHGYSNGNAIVFSDTGGGITAHKFYYVCEKGTDTFKIDDDSGCASTENLTNNTTNYVMKSSLTATTTSGSTTISLPGGSQGLQTGQAIQIDNAGSWLTFGTGAQDYATIVSLGTNGAILDVAADADVTAGPLAFNVYATKTLYANIASIGDCTSGACFDGSSDGGTYISLYDGNSNYSKIAAGDSSTDLTWTFPTAYPAADAVLYSSNAGAMGTKTAAELRTFLGLDYAYFFLSGSGMWPSTTNGCAANAQLELGTNDVDIYTLDFDAATAEYAQGTIAAPGDWNASTLTAYFYWSHPAATAYKVRWCLQCTCVRNDDAMDATWGTAVCANDEGGTTSDLYVSPETSAITCGGTCTALSLINFRAYRDATDATNDTLDVDGRLHGIRVKYGR